MDASLNTQALLQWYVDMGADESIGDAPVNRMTVVEKPPLSQAHVLPIASNPTTTKPQAPAISDLEEAKNAAMSAQSLDELKQVLESFAGLTLRRTAKSMVFSDGNPAAKIMVIGDAPGADEDKAGAPFAGEGGAYLDRMFAAIKLTRSQHLYLTTIINWRPPGGRAPLESEIALHLPFLHRHIALVNPALLVLVGGAAAKTVLARKENAAALRGQWLEARIPGLEKPVPALVLFSPAYLMGAPQQKALAWEDLKMLQTKAGELALIDS